MFKANYEKKDLGIFGLFQSLKINKNLFFSLHILEEQADITISKKACLDLEHCTTKIDLTLSLLTYLRNLSIFFCQALRLVK